MSPNPDNRLNEQEYEARLQQIIGAFSETLTEYSAIWKDVPYPNEVGEFPIGGILLSGDFGRRKATSESVVEVSTMVDGREGEDLSSSFVEDFGKKLSERSMKVDPMAESINFRDAEELRLMLDEQKGNIVIIYQPKSEMKSVVQPILNRFRSITCRWIAASV